MGAEISFVRSHRGEKRVLETRNEFVYILKDRGRAKISALIARARSRKARSGRLVGVSVIVDSELVRVISLPLLAPLPRDHAQVFRLILPLMLHIKLYAFVLYIRNVDLHASGERVSAICHEARSRKYEHERDSSTGSIEGFYPADTCAT